MFQAIVTKFIGPTNSRGSRVKATAAAGSVTLSWDYSLNHEANHDAAAKALADKFGWKGQWHGGGMPGNSGNCYVCGLGSGFPSFSTDGEQFSLRRVS